MFVYCMIMPFVIQFPTSEKVTFLPHPPYSQGLATLPLQTGPRVV